MRELCERTQAERQREKRRRCRCFPIHEVGDDLVRDRNWRDRNDGQIVAEDSRRPPVIGEKQEILGWIARNMLRRQVDDRVPADLRHGERPHKPTLRRQVEVVHFEGIDRRRHPVSEDIVKR